MAVVDGGYSFHAGVVLELGAIVYGEALYEFGLALTFQTVQGPGDGGRGFVFQLDDDFISCEAFREDKARLIPAFGPAYDGIHFPMAPGGTGGDFRWTLLYTGALGVSGGLGFGLTLFWFWLLFWKVLICEVWEVEAGIYVAVECVYGDGPGVGFGPAFQGGVWAGLMVDNLVLYEVNEGPVVAEFRRSAFGGLLIIVILLSDIGGIAPMVYEVFVCMPIAATIKLVVDGGQTTTDIASELFLRKTVLVLLHVKPVHVRDFRHFTLFFPFVIAQGIGRGRRGAWHTKRALFL